MADKSLNEIRNTFLKYFEKNDHKIVESSNLVPNNDPTLMFANSCDEATGMGWGGNWEAMDDNAANKIDTTDGGETWELLTPGAGPGYRSCVQYVPHSNCQSIWAVGIPGISRSIDGGGRKGWTKLIPSYSSDIVYMVKEF